MQPPAETPAHVPDRVPALDLLRLVAVLGVVLFHYGFRGPTGHGVTHVALPDLAFLGRYGFLGVPVFFVISGFVIAYSAEGRSASGFAVARFARIYPTFVFCMTLTFLVVLLFGAPHFETSFAQWAANLLLAAVPPHPYMDSAYWSLAVEIIFYAWVVFFIWLGLFPRRVDIIIAVWLGISVLNELTIDARFFERFLLTDYSGFFATGILIYQFHRGRRDALLQWLMAASVGTAAFHAVHNLAWLREQTGDPFDDWAVAAICLASILVILLATRIRRLPLPPGVVIAIGGVTYPLYLLHQQLGYVVYEWIGPVSSPAALVASILLAITAVSWATWRFVERPVQRWTKQVLKEIAGRLGFASPPQPAAAQVSASQ
jgi:peptidoglycan/LPS O-acetylase OafA/YrhL